MKPIESTFIITAQADVRRIPIATNSVDLIVTSPPYWQKRDYGMPGQIGQEASVDEYIAALMQALEEWRRVLTPFGSVFLNIGDSYRNRALVGVPARFEIAASEAGWTIRNRIIWAKKSGMPEPSRTKLANRHEFIFHLVQNNDYYYDLFEYSHRYGNGSNPGDVWHIKMNLSGKRHLAPFPGGLVKRAILLGCPEQVCTECGKPRERIVERTAELDLGRPQARRAMELAEEHNLTDEHIAAIQATGISDAGKARRFQNGTGRNSLEVQKLAKEAKEALGGYFREFTFAKKKTVGWTDCSCGDEVPLRPGIVFDPFVGTGTTLRVAKRLGRSAIGTDISIPEYLRKQEQLELL